MFMSTTSPTLTTFRTYELFDIHWDRGSQWTNYDTEAEAQAVIDGCGSSGRVVRRTWEVECHPSLLALGMYRPGVSERTEVAS